MRRRALGMLLVMAIAAVTPAGCTKSATPSPFADCSSLPTAAPTTATAGETGTRLPDVSLPCFTGETTVTLRELRGPAVINVWASWCAPCRTELPVMQRLADAAGKELAVLGVDTGDPRESGATFATDAGVRMPTLFDEDQKLMGALTRSSLPVTIFLGANGQTYVHPLPLDADGLVEQVRTHTGVTVVL